MSACRIDGVLGGLVLLYGHSSFYYPLAEMSLMSMAAPAAALQALNPIDALLSTINTNPYFIGCMMVLLNLGGRFLSMEVTKEQEKFFQNTWVRGFLIFVVLFIATRNILISFVMSLVIILLVRFLFNENSLLYLFKNEGMKDINNADMASALTHEESEIYKKLSDKLEKSKEVTEKTKSSEEMKDVYSIYTENMGQLLH